MAETFIVWDSRNGRVLPAVGPGDKPVPGDTHIGYTAADASNMANELNQMVLRNTMPALSVTAQVKGPFYIRPAKMRHRCEGRCS
jgi:hypothetical protein